jgi:hypothetical protein
MVRGFRVWSNGVLSLIGFVRSFVRIDEIGFLLMRDHEVKPSLAYQDPTPVSP